MSTSDPALDSSAVERFRQELRARRGERGRKSMKDPNNGPFYAAGLYVKLCKVFREHGYALAVHGSLANDFDLIAVPWVDEAGDPQHVIDELLKKFGELDSWPRWQRPRLLIPV